MSAQTGEDVPEAPTSERAADRARFRFDLLRRDPNPIWVRELKQSARLVRTPFVLMSLCVLMTLVIAALGAAMDADGDNDRIGAALFHVYFSLAYFVVAFAGPAIAANSIASEREGRTWEAVMLTGLKPEVIARGKFLAALTSIATYLAMLAPVGALSFLFGGVSAGEVVIAFLFLLAIGTVFVLFGLAISSQTQSLRVSLIATLFFTVPLATSAFVMIGVVGSGFVHALWPKVPSALPIWLPAAYLRGDFGFEYVLLLIAGPIVFFGVPSWFLYQTVVANLKDANDDQWSGRKRWFAIATPVLAAVVIATLFLVAPRNAFAVGGLGIAGLLAHLGFCVLVFAGEPVGASRRVRAAWDRRGASFLTRAFGPSLAKATALQVVVGAVSVLAVIVATWNATRGTDKYGRTIPWEQTFALLTFDGYLLAFYFFMVGATAWIRLRLSTTVTRVVTIVLAGGLSVAPWVIAIVAQALLRDDSRPGDGLVALAAPSPFYAFYLASRIARQEAGVHLVAGYATMGVWVALGLLLSMLAARKSTKLVRALDDQADATERRLALEDLNHDAALRASDPERVPSPFDAETATDAGEPASVADPEPEPEKPSS